MSVINFCPACGHNLQSNEDNGWIKKVCMRSGCGETLLVKAWHKYDADNPLFCAQDCIALYARRDHYVNYKGMTSFEAEKRSAADLMKEHNE